MLASSAVIRRQQFIIRSLGGYNNLNRAERIQQQQVKFATRAGMDLEADAENVLRRITPTLDPNRHKGQAGEPLLFLISVCMHLKSKCIL